MQEKDKNPIEVATKKDAKIVLSELVGGDKYIEFVITKLEKISAATYIIGNFIPDSDPLRAKLRNLAIRLVELKMSLYGKMSYFPTDRIKETILCLVELESLLGVASHARLVSLMNYSILSEECLKLVGGLRSHFLEEGGKVLDGRFFAHVQEPQHTHGLEVPRESTRERVSSQPKSSVLYSSEAGNGSRVAAKKKARRELILRLLREKERISIKDFSNLIKDCSEKTIQRELLEMVEEGVVQKQGERRWSTYSLKK